MVIQRTSPLLLFAFVPLTLVLAATKTEALLKPGAQYSVPFEEGEKVGFEINWKPVFFIPAFKAGQLELTVDRIQYKTEDVYRISADAVSAGALASVAGLNVADHFESIISSSDFRSRRYLYQKRQNEKKEDLEVLVDYAAGTTTTRRTDVSVKPPRELSSESVEGIPGALVDNLSVFYIARVRKLEAGQQYRVHLADNGKIKDVTLEIQKREKIKTPLGTYDTIKISTVGGLFKGGGDFRIWYTVDDLRIPVKFEADVNFGKVYGQLTKLETPGFAQSVIRGSK